MIKLYTIKNKDGKFFHEGMGGYIYWTDFPDYRNATRDSDQCCGWKYNLKERYPDIEVVELTISW